MTSTTPRPRGRPALAFLAATAVGALACSDAGGSPDTSSVTQGMLESRDEATATVPYADAPAASRAPARSERPEESGSSSSAQSGEIRIADLGYTIGDTDAPLQIVEFSDFGCGYCKQFHTDVWPTLREQYVESGKIQWKHVPMILGIFGENADAAAEAAECALEQDGFTEVKHRLFVDQADWKRVADPMPALRGFVDDEGLDVDAWDACMASDRTVPRVDAGTTLSRQAGVRGTPTFFIVGVGAIPGLVPLETFQQVLDTIYAQATR